MTELEEIQSRNEAILRSIIDGTEYVALPQSRIEELLLQLKEVIVAGGGSVSPEDIQAAIEEYLNTHDADIVTEQELSDALAGKVDKETNKSLMSADEHTKLNNIEVGAQVNTVTGVKGSNEADYRVGNVSITKGNVGLGNVDNTADADKPISTATQTALAGKQNALAAGANITIETVNDILTISAIDTTYSAATPSSSGAGGTAGLLSAADKEKLDGIAAGAQVNVKPDWNATSGSAAEILNKPTIPNYSNATTSTAGLMSAADKTKLDGMTSVLNAEILFDSPSGTAVTNVSPSLSFASGKSLSAYTDGYLEVFYRQNGGTNGGVNSVRTAIHSVSGSVTVEPVQLLGWEYDSANTALALTGCAGTVSNGNTVTFSNPENADFSFTVYRIIGYKAVGA